MSRKIEFSIKLPNDYPECLGCKNSRRGLSIALNTFRTYHLDRTKGVGTGTVECTEDRDNNQKVITMVETRGAGNLTYGPVSKGLVDCPGRIEQKKQS